MILKIVPDLDSSRVLSTPPNVKLLDYKSFNMLEVHPFIASNNWEEIQVVIGKGIISGYLKEVITRSNVVKAIIPQNTELTFELVSRLMELYPGIANKLRVYSMSKKDVTPLLKEVGVIFE